MKVLEKIKNIFLGILTTIFFAFALAMSILLLNFNDYGVTEFGDKSLIILTEEITSDEFEKGDLVIVEKRRLELFEVGDTAFVYRIDKNGKANIEVGKVGKLYPDENAIGFENGSVYAMEFVAGEAEEVYEDIGLYLSIIQSKWGFLFMILVPGFLIFVYELYSLIIEIKYGSEE